MHPAHAWRHPPHLLENCEIRRPPKNDVRCRRGLRESLGCVADCGVSLRQRLQHGQLWRSWIGQNQKVDMVHGEKSILRHVQCALHLVQPVVQFREPGLLGLQLAACICCKDFSCSSASTLNIFRPSSNSRLRPGSTAWLA